MLFVVGASQQLRRKPVRKRFRTLLHRVPSGHGTQQYRRWAHCIRFHDVRQQRSALQNWHKSLRQPITLHKKHHCAMPSMHQHMNSKPKLVAVGIQHITQRHGAMRRKPASEPTNLRFMKVTRKMDCATIPAGSKNGTFRCACAPYVFFIKNHYARAWYSSNTNTFGPGSHRKHASCKSRSMATPPKSSASLYAQTKEATPKQPVRPVLVSHAQRAV